MKNKFWAFVIALLIIAPSVVAVGSYFYTKGSPVTQNSIGSVTMTDLYDQEYTFERNNSPLDLSNIGSNMVQFFTDINTSAKSEPELPEPLQGTKYFKVVINNFRKDIEYKYYFSKQPEYCYYLDENGKCFSIDREYAAAFLTSVYGRSVFKNATLPVMKTPAGEVIEPDEIKWTYLAIDDKAATYTAKNPDDNETVYNMAEKIDFDFTIDEGSLNIKVSDGKEVLYNSLYEGLELASIPTGVELDVRVDAKWYQTEDRKSEGEAAYSFKCRIVDKPVFTIGTNSSDIVPGDFVNIMGKNVISDPSSISVTCLPDIKVTPVFYTDGDAVKALLPIPLTTPAGNYTLKINSDGAEHELEFTVEANPYGTTKYEAISSNLLNDESIAAFDDAMKEILTKESGERYFEGGFAYPTRTGDVASGYGRPTQTEGGYKYTNNYVRLVAASGSNIKAMNAGKVVYVGEQTITGNTVVVDHGLGLMTVYGNMVTISVSVGDIVATGDTIGVSGNVGYTDGSLVTVAMAINGTYVCPYEIWDDTGIVFDEEE